MTVQEKKNVKTNNYHRYWRIKAIQSLGAKCVRCGFSDYRALQIDHINGYGRKDKASHCGSYYKRVIESSLNKENIFQILCSNCNIIKRIENDETAKGYAHREGRKITVSQEIKDKISEAHTGKIISIETRLKMALAHIGKPSGRLGKKLNRKALLK